MMPEKMSKKNNEEASGFDSWAEDYSNILDKFTSKSGENSIFFVELKMKLLRDYFNNKANSHLKILDFGCGTGRTAKFVKKYFPKSEFFGVDPSKKSIAVAKKNYPKKNYPNYSFDTLDTKRGLNLKRKFDIIFSAVVFHHISPRQRKAALRQILNSLKDGGFFVLFEHNPYNPLVLKIVKDCPFDKGVVLIKPQQARYLFQEANLKIEKQAYYFFFPRFLSFLRWSERLLAGIPLGAQYMLVGRK